MSESDCENRDIDSDDDFINCYECETEVEVAEVCLYKKDKFCKSCYEECIQFDIAQPVRMVYKVYEDISYSCCSRKNCIRIKCCGTVQGHVHLFSCDPEIVNYPLGLAGIFSKKNMYSVKEGVWTSQPFEETNLLRRLRLQKTERLESLKVKKVKQKEKEKLEEDAKEIASRYAAIREANVSNYQNLLADEYFSAAKLRLQRKEKWESLTIGTKVAELEVEICRKLHDSNWNSYAGGGDGGLGLRLMLYQNYRFKELQKTCPVIEQAGRALYNFSQEPHNQIENPYEKKDQIEKILVIFEEWLEAIDPIRYCEVKGLSRLPINWKSLENLINDPLFLKQKKRETEM